TVPSLTMVFNDEYNETRGAIPRPDFILEMRIKGRIQSYGTRMALDRMRQLMPDLQLGRMLNAGRAAKENAGLVPEELIKNGDKNILDELARLVKWHSMRGALSLAYETE